jgi:2-C-methyl-D-erythritol 4-phosphate cytidylyltransferase
METFAVIVAGGSGQRMGTTIPKQFLTIAGKPVLWYTITSFIEAIPGIKIILVLPEQHLTSGHELMEASGDFSSIIIVAGGANRFQSVKNGLSMVKVPSVVMVHDGVRCLPSAALIRRCYETAVLKGNAVPAIAAADSIRIASASGNKPMDRNQVFLVQTPQTFLSEQLLEAFDQPYDDSFTDEATVVEKIGIAIHLVEGEITNIKITRPIDLLVAGQLLSDRKLMDHQPDPPNAE